MKLNPDCIRDILITVERTTDFTHSFIYSISDSPTEPLSNYSSEEIVYHISQCDKANLIEVVKYMDGGDCIIIGDLSPDGHALLADIRSDKIWNNVKHTAKEIGVASLPSLLNIASSVISKLVNASL